MIVAPVIVAPVIVGVLQLATYATATACVHPVECTFIQSQDAKAVAYYNFILNMDPTV